MDNSELFSDFVPDSQLAQGHAVVGANSDPERAAKALTLQKNAGVPASVGEPDLDRFMQEFKQKQASQAVQNNPAAASYVNSNPMAAKVSGDDWPAMSQASKTAGDVLGHSLINTVLGFYHNNQNIVQSAKEGAKEGFGDQPLGIDPVKYPNFYNIWQLMAAPLDAAYRAPGAAVGATAKSIAQMYVNFGGNESEAARLDRDLRIFGTGAMIETGITDPFSISRAMTGELGKAKPAATPIMDAVKEGRRGKLEQVASDFGIENAKDLSDEELKSAIIKKDSESSGAKPEFTPEAKASLQAGEVPRPGADPTFDQLHMTQQKVDAIKLRKLIEDTDATKTKERSPEMMQEFLHQHGEGTETISLPVDKVKELYEKEGKEPGAGDGLLGFVPNLPEKIRQGLETNTEIKIPLAQYVANTNLALHDKLADFIRSRPEGVNAEEAKELGNKEPENVTLYRAEGGTKTEGVVEPYANEGKFFTSDLEKAKQYSKEYGDTPLFKLELPQDSEHILRYDAASNEYVVKNEAAAEMKPYEPGIAQSLPERAISEAPKGGEAVAGSLAENAQRVQDSLYLHPLIQDAKTVGITDSEFKKYSNLIERRQDELLTRIVAAAEREVKKPLTEEWKKNEEKTREKVEAETAKRSEIYADQLLRTGRIDTRTKTAANSFLPLKFEGAKLDAAEVESVLGKAYALDDLVGKKDTLDADTVAMLTGFRDGRAMLKALDQYNAGRKKLGLSPQRYFDAIVEKETADRMRATHGILADQILEQARNIALSDIQGDIFTTEIKFLADKAGLDTPLSKEALRERARLDFGQLQLHEVPKEAELRRAIEKGGRDAEKALLKGKFEDAFIAKLAQRQAFWTFKEWQSFQRDQAKLDRDVKTVGNDDSASRIASDHLMQSRRILDRLGVSKGRYPEGMEPFAQFVENADGRIAAADWITLDEGLRTSMDQLTVNEIRDLQKTLQSVLHVGRDQRRIDVGYANALLENVVRDGIAEMSRFNDIPSSDLKGPMNKTRALVRSFSASHMLFERLLDYTDKYDPRGVFSTYVDRPLRESYGTFLRYQRELKPLLDELRQYTDKRVTDQITNDLIKDPRNPTLNNGNLTMDHQQLRRLMMYMGSRSGREKAIRGFFQARDANPLDPMEMDFLGRKVEKLIADNATENDVKFVNAIFGIHDKLLPDIKDLQMKETGVPMEEVQPLAYDTPAGKVNGGYVKIRYDKTRSSIDEDLRAKNSIYEDGHQRITTPHSYTKSRTGYTGYLDLDMSLFASELATQVHDLAFRSSVRQVEKLFNNPNLMMKMRQTWSDEYAALADGWLRDIANATTVDDTYAKGLVQAAAQFRKNVVSAFVGFNVGTAEKHGLSALSMSIREVGLKDFSKNFVDMFKSAQDLVDQVATVDPEHAQYLKGLMTEGGMRQIKFALESSEMLRGRVMKPGDSIHGAYQEATSVGPWSYYRTMRDWTQFAGRWPISFLDTASTIPEWLAAYKRDFMANGDHDTAVYAADKAVSRSHGSAFTGDAPAILRNKNNALGEFFRWATPLYKFWNHNLMQITGLKWDAMAMMQGRAEPGANMASIAHALFWAAIVPAFVEEISQPPLDDRKGGYHGLKAVGRYLGSHFVGIRELTNWALDGHEPSVGFVGSVGHTIGQAVKAMQQGGSNAIKNLIGAFSILTGVGSVPLGGEVQYGEKVLSGKETPNSPAQVMQGIRTGSQKRRRY